MENKENLVPYDPIEVDKLLKKILIEKGEKIFLPAVYLVGFKYTHQDPKVLKDASKKPHIKFVRQKSNTYDSHAVALILDGQRLCYVGKDYSQQVAAFIEKYGAPNSYSVCNIFKQSAQVNLTWIKDVPYDRILSESVAKTFCLRHGIGPKEGEENEMVDVGQKEIEAAMPKND